MINFFRAYRRLLVCASLLSGAAGAGASDPVPKLVVAISIDQFRADYLARFKEHFGPDGFNLFLQKGANFANCHYQHSVTKTACGHAVMLTGVHANVHGIIANEWIDRSTFEKISCVGDPSVQVLGLPMSAAPRWPGVSDPYLARSPRNLQVNTVGDELKIYRGGRPKVIGISNKDRSAILMSGKLADAAYFMERGRMVSSTYYFSALPEWVQTWNDSGKVDAFFGKVWDRVLPEAAYAVQGVDAAPGEDNSDALFGNAFPKTVTAGEKKPGLRFYDLFETTPFANEALTDFAQAAIEHEQLGQRAGVTDLLCLSFSAQDSIGHRYGPDSHEVMDNVVRMDRTLAAFFKYLDERIGLKNCTLVLTADHGIPPMPEQVHAINSSIPASRNYAGELVTLASSALERTFGPLADGSAWFVRDDTSFLFYPAALREKKIDSAVAQAVVRDALLASSFVQAAYTRTQLEKNEVTDELGRRAVLSFNRERSGDVFFQTKPYFFSSVYGSNHGSPYNYDTHVPLLWYGVGVTLGTRTERVGVDDLAPTLAHILGLNAPPFALGRILF